MAAATGQAFYTDVLLLTPVIDPIKLSAKLSANPVRYDGAETVTGTPSYLPFDKGTAYKALAGQPVRIYNADGLNPTTAVASGTTNASGGFTIKLPDSGLGSTSWTVGAGNSAGDYLFGPAKVALGMTVQVPTVISNVHVTLSQYWKLSFSGCLSLAEKAPVSARDGGVVAFQYSSGGANGPWHTLVNNVPEDGFCGDQGIWLAWSANAPRNDAYYRFYFAGYKYGAGDLLASSSKSVLAWKYADRIVGLSVSPHVVANNGRISVKGQLQYYSDYKWRDYGSQTASIIFRQRGSSTWYWIVKAKTNSSGHFSATVKDQFGSATWSAQYDGNGSHLATAPAGVSVRVT